MSHLSSKAIWPSNYLLFPWRCLTGISNSVCPQNWTQEKSLPHLHKCYCHPSTCSCSMETPQFPVGYQLPVPADAAFKTSFYSGHVTPTSWPPPSIRPCYLFPHTVLPPPTPTSNSPYISTNPPLKKSFMLLLGSSTRCYWFSQHYVIETYPLLPSVPLSLCSGLCSHSSKIPNSSSPNLPALDSPSGSYLLQTCSSLISSPILDVCWRAFFSHLCGANHTYNYIIIDGVNFFWSHSQIINSRATKFWIPTHKSVPGNTAGLLRLSGNSRGLQSWQPQFLLRSSSQSKFHSFAFPQHTCITYILQGP